MCDAWYENIHNGELNGVVFIDIRKAFDSINHNILLPQMKEQFGISNIELKLFEFYLSLLACSGMYSSSMIFL